MMQPDSTPIRMPTAPEAGRVEQRRMWFVVGTMLLGAAWSFAGSYMGGGWKSASVIVAIIFGLYVVYIARYRNAVLGRLLLVAITAGFAELLADRWLVDSTGTLFYVPGEPLLVRSPVYMPFAWSNVLVALAYLGSRIAERWSIAIACVALALFGAVYIPAYEYWANGSGWWTYRNTAAIGAAPFYIILGEFLIVLAMPIAARYALRLSAAWSIAIGVVVGLWIWAAYAIAFAVAR